MAQVRYLGFVVGDGAPDPARETPALGRFVSLAEPLPVGTLVEVDGASHQVTRIDESATPGCWLRPAGAARPVAVQQAAVPVTVDDEATTRSAPRTAEAPTFESPAIELVAGTSDDEAPAPESASPPAGPAPEDGAPEPTPDEGSRGNRRKRRPKKTVLGR